jgi:3-oxoadipate enol-lactonase
MTESGDGFDALRLPVEPLAPRPAAVADLRTRLHRRLGVEPPRDTVAMRKAVGLEYETSGPADGEPVLLIHAGTATAYAPLMTHPSLVERHRLIRYHRRGYAGSDPLSHEASIGTHAQDALRLLDHLGIDSAHVVGHSGSGLIALQLAIDAPQVVRSLVLEEPAMHAVDPRLQAIVRDAVAPIVETHRNGDSRRAMDRWMRGISRGWRVELTRTVPGGPQQTLDDAGAFFADVDAVFDWQFDHDGVSALDMPVLYLIAAASLPGTRAVMRAFRELVPQTETAVIDDATHMLHTDQPGRVGDELAAFFARNRT